MLTWTLLGVVAGALILWKLLSGKKYKLPPGPSGLPFFGNVYQLDPNSPHGTITKWSEQYGDVFKIKIFGDDFVVLNSFEAIYEGLVTKANDFAGRPDMFRFNVLISNCDDISFRSLSPKWTFLKKTALQSLKMYGDNLENLEVITLDLIKDMHAELKEEAAMNDGVVEMEPTIHRCITGIISSILYGHKVSHEDAETLIKTTAKGQTVLSTTGPQLLLDIFPSLRYIMRGTYRILVEMQQEVEEWFNREIKSRWVEYEPGNPQCFLDAMFDHQKRCDEHQEEFRITNDNIYGVNTDLIFAGTVTTTISMQGLIAVLVNKPDLQAKMATMVLDVIGDREPRLKDRTSLAYIEAAILELLRYSSILPLNVTHLTTVDTDINGFGIPKDTRVMFNLWKLHHSSEYWDEPFEFRPERFLDNEGKVVPPGHSNRKRLLPFGASRRVCIGEALAKNRLFLITTSLLQHFKFLPEGPGLLPSHDPRDYVTGFGIMPKPYKVKLVMRL